MTNPDQDIKDRIPLNQGPAGMISAVVAGLLILTTVVLLIQPYDPRNVPVLGLWPYSYFLLSISFGLAGLVILLLRRSGRTGLSGNLALVVLGFYLFILPLEMVSHTRLVGVVGEGLYGFLWHIPNPAVRRSLASNCGFTTSRDFIHYQGLPAYLPRPGSRYRIRLPIDEGIHRTISIDLDREGFNNRPEVASLKKVDTVMVGDSFTFGEVDPEANFSAVAMKESGRPVLNLGQGGYGPQQIRWAIENRALSRSPQRIVWGFYWNDLGDAVNVENWLKNYNDRTWFQFLGDIGKSSWWYQGDKQTRATWIYFPDIILGFMNLIRHNVLFPREKSRSQVMKVPVRGKAHLFIATSAIPGEGFPLAKSLAEWREKGEISRAGGRIEFAMPKKEALALIEQEIAGAAKSCRERGIELVMMPIPSRLYVYTREVLTQAAKEGHYKGIPAGQGLPRIWDTFLFQWLEEVAERHGLSYWDLPGHLRRVAQEPGRGVFYYAVDKHLNRAGNKAVGEFVAARIRAAR